MKDYLNDQKMQALLVLYYHQIQMFAYEAFSRTVLVHVDCYHHQLLDNI
jgi:hypothetical protein